MQSVIKVDTSANTVTTSKESTIKYDHLVLSPGGKPKKIPVDGANLDGVLVLRTVNDTKAITSAVNKDSEIVIIGTSFIGMEVSMALLKKEPKSVTLVGMDEVPFEAILGKEIGVAIMEVRGRLRDKADVQNMKKQGIKFIMKAGVEKIIPDSMLSRLVYSLLGAERVGSESNPSHCGSVQLKGQDPLPASFVIMGTGVSPATDFLKSSGFTLEKDGGIATDEYMRVKGHQNVYAIGDIAHYTQYPDKFQRRVEHWNCAANHVSMISQDTTG